MVTRKILKIDEKKCNGCGLCIPTCAEGALKVVNGKARLISEKYCDGLGACIGQCPQGAISIEERDAQGFDEGAVKKHLNTEEAPTVNPVQPISHFCSSTKTTRSSTLTSEKTANPLGRGKSTLSQWPVKITLVPVNAEFFENADLAVVADCVPFAYANFYSDFLRDKKVVIGCPKLDNVQLYEKKLTEIFKQSCIQNVNVVNMEVPCCNGLYTLVRRALNAVGKRIPLKQEVISVKGEKVPQRPQASKQISITGGK